MKRFILFCVILSSFQFAHSADNYRLAPGSSLFISEHGLCAQVTNNFTTDLFIPTKSKKEVNRFMLGTSPSMAVVRQGCSCDSLYHMGNFTSGNYSVDTDGAGPLAPFTVYCDMVTDGGGWTLVARSVSGGSSSSFGWNNSTGSVSDDANPYSLGVLTTGIKFHEVLFGDYSSGKTWGIYVYKHESASNDFLATHSGTPLTLGTPLPVSGGNPNFLMAQQLGYSSESTFFFFRDHPGFVSYGLQPAGWDSVYADHMGGYINGAQGMVMVR